MSQESRTRRKCPKDQKKTITDRKKSREVVDKAEKNTQSDDEEVENRKKFNIIPRFLRRDLKGSRKITNRACSKEGTQQHPPASPHKRRSSNEQVDPQHYKGKICTLPDYGGLTNKARKSKPTEGGTQNKKKISRRSRRVRMLGAQPNVLISPTPTPTSTPIPTPTPIHPDTRGEVLDNINTIRGRIPTVDPYIKTERPKRTYMEPDDDVEVSDREQGKKDPPPPEQEPEAEKIQDRRSLIIEKFCKNGIRELIKEFASLKDLRPSEDDCKAFKTFEVRNRYADVFCLDSSRVVLKSRERDDDYIHASYISMPNSSSHKYICAQGPTEETVADFWHMVVHEDVSLIVMVCQFVEDNSEKCTEYFSADPGTTHLAGEFSVHTETTEVLEHNIACRRITVKHRNDTSVTKTITHLWWGEWPDHLAPLEADPVLYLLRQMKLRAGDKMVVVHCSAGIGRTGTLVAVDLFNERLKNSTRGLTICDIFKKFREERAHAIQSLVQYIFLHVCLVKIALDDKVMKEDKDVLKFLEDYKKYMTKLMKKKKKKKPLDINPDLHVVGMDVRPNDNEKDKSQKEIRQQVDDKCLAPGHKKSRDGCKE